MGARINRAAERAGWKLLRWAVTVVVLAGAVVGLWAVIRHSILPAGDADEVAVLWAAGGTTAIALALASTSAVRVRHDLRDVREKHGREAGAAAAALLRTGVVGGMAVRGIVRGSADLLDWLAFLLSALFSVVAVGWWHETRLHPVIPWVAAVVLGLVAAVTVARRVAAMMHVDLAWQHVRQVPGWPVWALAGAGLGASAMAWLAATYGRIEVPALITSALTGVGLVLGLVGARFEGATNGRKAALASQLAATMGINESRLGADGDIRWSVTRDGSIVMHPSLPAAVVSALAGDLESRLASTMPDYELGANASATEGLALVPASPETRAARLAAESTGGLAVEVRQVPDEPGTTTTSRELWVLRPGIRGSAAHDIAQAAADRGLDLLRFDPDRRRAGLGRLDDRTRALRERVAQLIGARELWDIGIRGEWDDDGQLAEFTVLWGAGVHMDPEKRREAWSSVARQVAPLDDDETWTLDDNPAAGTVTMTRRRDPLREVVPYDWGIEPTYTSIPFAVDEAGAPVSLGLLEVNQLLGGTPGGGKSGGITALLSGIARLEHVALIGLDPKRVEQTLWRPRFSRIATEPDDATAVLEALRDEMERRYGWLQEQGLKKIGPGQLSADRPLLVVVIDELADLVSVGSTKEEKAEELKRSTLIRRLIALGRAAGVVVIAATQKPQSDVVPTALRDLIQLRVAYATTNPAMTETILGAGMAQTGGLSHEISAAERGVAYIVTETSRTPRRVRTRWVPDEEVAGIAERYAHLRVELPWMPDESQVRRRSMREGEIITPAPAPAPVIEEDLGTIDLGLEDLDLDDPAPEPEPAGDSGEEEFEFDEPAPAARPRGTGDGEEFVFDVVEDAPQPVKEEREEDPAAAWGF